MIEHDIKTSGRDSYLDSYLRFTLFPAVNFFKCEDWEPCLCPANFRH